MSEDESTSEIEDREFDAGDLSTDGSDAQDDALQDYEDSVGSDSHEAEVAEAREGAGIDDGVRSEE